jgi:hypothetical protein
MDLADWLQSLDLERYEPAFRGNEIDDTVLPNLTAEDLKDLGFPKKLLPVTNTRKIGKHSMTLNSAKSSSSRRRSMNCIAGSLINK